MVTDLTGLFFVAGFQTVIDMFRPVPRKHLGHVGFFVAFHNLHLLGAPLQRGFAVLRRHGIRIDQLLGKARFSENECRNKGQSTQRSHGQFLSPEMAAGSRDTATAWCCQKKPARRSSPIVASSSDSTRPTPQNSAMVFRV